MTSSRRRRHQIYYKDWGKGQPSYSATDGRLHRTPSKTRFFLLPTIPLHRYDRRAWPLQPAVERQRQDTYADDLAELSRSSTFRGDSTAAYPPEERVGRYIGRHGTKRV